LYNTYGSGVPDARHAGTNGRIKVADARKYTTGEARSKFAEVINEAVYGPSRVVLTRRGKEVAAVVPIADLQLLYDLERIIDLNEAEASINQAKKTGTVSLAELKKRLKL
jgi:prevent-host-death family protein